ncbi:tetratricopeptide repeat protein, partial [Paracidovorax cattleyae]|uniref:tetratricopeptide repeat protein n=1 Tax=Paracidovorax cattleyae TaxID=80868 RepID=UPI003EB87D90
AYARGRYERALQRAEAALRLRPDVARLQLLQVYALQKLGRNKDALRAAEQAVARGASSPELEAAVANLRPQPAAQGAATTEAYRLGFPVATRAYEQYNRGDYAQAARTAEETVRLDPSQGPWVLLWLDALQDGQRYEDAIRAGGEALALGAPNRNDIEARVRLARQAIANRYAQQAYDAIARNKPLEGVPAPARPSGWPRTCPATRCCSSASCRARRTSRARSRPPRQRCRWTRRTPPCSCCGPTCASSWGAPMPPGKTSRRCWATTGSTMRSAAIRG